MNTRYLIATTIFSLLGHSVFAQLDSLRVRDARFVSRTPAMYGRSFAPQLKYYTASGMPQIGTGFYNHYWH